MPYMAECNCPQTGRSHSIRDRSVTMAVNVLHAAEALRDGIALL